jgi:hypothetical protein
MRRAVAFLAFLALVAAFALASWLAWWAVPLVAALWGLLRPAVWRPILSAALAAALGWGCWLLLDALSDPSALARLGQRLGAVMQLPFPLLLLLTLLFPALLAWSASALACGLAGLLAGDRKAD